MSLRAVILVALSAEELTGYEIKKEFEAALGFLWNASHQQIYRELGQMVTDELIEFRVVPQEGKPDSKRYSITSKGKAELMTWLEAPPPSAVVRSALMVKVYAGAILGLDKLLKHIASFRAESTAMLATLNEIEQIHYAEPVLEMEDWLKLSYLTLRYGKLQQETNVAWADEVEKLLLSMGNGAAQTIDDNRPR